LCRIGFWRVVVAQSIPRSELKAAGSSRQAPSINTCRCRLRFQSHHYLFLILKLYIRTLGLEPLYLQLRHKIRVIVCRCLAQNPDSSWASLASFSPSIFNNGHLLRWMNPIRTVLPGSASFLPQYHRPQS